MAEMASIVCYFAVLVIAGFAEGKPQVKTSLGTFTGEVHKFNGSQVESFRGIPYAKPPVGDLRFALPQAFGPVGDLKAADYSPRCVQVEVPIFSAFGRSPESEDCLYLNIFRKEGTQQDAKKPVIFAIHGGAFCVGSASDFVMNPVPITALGDVIVVSINYRLGILGFADMKELAPGNIGLYDQLLALQWVHDNIADFGGDPDNLTLLGVSAGSMSVGAILSTPLVRGKNLFKKVIMDAGVPSRAIVKTQDESLKRVQETAAKLGCDTEGDKMLSCLRSANATDLVRSSYDKDFSLLFTFVPTIDGKFFPTDAAKEIQDNSDKFVDVKLIIGVAKNEGTIFTAMYDAVKTLKSEEEFVALSKQIAKGYLFPIDLNDKRVKDAVVSTYFEKSANRFYDAAEFLGDGTFTCPTNAFVKSYAKTHNNIYVYNFNKLMKRKYVYFDPQIAGAFHTTPFGHLFGSLLAIPEAALDNPFHPEDKQYMLDSIKTITDFVKFNDVPKFREVTWPNYAKGEGVLLFDDNVTVASDLSHEDRCLKVFPFYVASKTPH